jgi:hypothetical protein
MLVYQMKGSEYRLIYGDGMYVNGARLQTAYARIEAPYCTFRRGEGALEVRFNGRRLYLDFERGLRTDD